MLNLGPCTANSRESGYLVALVPPALRPTPPPGPTRSTLPASSTTLALGSRAGWRGRLKWRCRSLGSAARRTVSCLSRGCRVTSLRRRSPEKTSSRTARSQGSTSRLDEQLASNRPSTPQGHPRLLSLRAAVSTPTDHQPRRRSQARRCKGTLLPLPGCKVPPLANHRSIGTRAIRRRNGIVQSGRHLDRHVVLRINLARVRIQLVMLAAEGRAGEPAAGSWAITGRHRRSHNRASSGRTSRRARRPPGCLSPIRRLIRGVRRGSSTPLASSKAVERIRSSRWGVPSRIPAWHSDEGNAGSRYGPPTTR